MPAQFCNVKSGMILLISVRVHQCGSKEENPQASFVKTYSKNDIPYKVNVVLPVQLDLFDIDLSGLR